MTLDMGRRAAIVAICLAILGLSGLEVAGAGAATLYVGATKRYSVALKTEAGDHYVIQLAGAARCHFNEPLEDVGLTGFSLFPGPRLMHERDGEWSAGDSQYEPFGSGSGGVRAKFARDSATGTYAYSYSLESEHCETPGRVPFRARRYVPAGTREAGRPIPRIAKTYYGQTGPLEVYLAVRGDSVAGVRGDFTGPCRVGRRERGQTLPLFGAPTGYKRDASGHFEGHQTATGRLGSGSRFREWFGISGRVGHDETTGTYLRVRSVLRGRRTIEHCVTGPLPFRAVHYLPARR